MIGFWRDSDLRAMLLILMVFVLFVNCWSLNDEGLSLLKNRERVVSDPFGALADWEDDVLVLNPCSWNGVECSNGDVISLNLGGMCIKGTLGPELAKWIHIKSMTISTYEDVTRLKLLRDESVLDISRNVHTQRKMLQDVSVLDIPKNVHIRRKLLQDVSVLDIPRNLPTRRKLFQDISVLHIPRNVHTQRKLLQDVSVLDIPRNVPTQRKLLQDLSVLDISENVHTRRKLLQDVSVLDIPGNVHTQRKLLQDAWFLDIPINVHTQRKLLQDVLILDIPRNVHTQQKLLQDVPILDIPRNVHTKRKLLQDVSLIDIPRNVHRQQKLLQDVWFLDIPRNVRTFKPFIRPSPLSSPSPLSPPAVSFPKGRNFPITMPPTSPPLLITPPLSKPIVLVKNSNSTDRRSLILYSTLGAVALFLALVTGVIFWRSNKLAVVNPWATGISGQLQRAFITGVPKLRRSELETACEDFSNVIGSSAVGTLYKGTLSSGVEIAVMSFSISSFKDWSIDQEKQFRKKIQTLSELNHKNSVNLLGYCEEDEPFTRMMVFEYAPNGTLFEHLHIKEAEHLDWGTRMRIVMGIAYCLEYMHEKKPPIAHKKLNSSVVYLTEDYAAKVSDFSIFSDNVVAKVSDFSIFSDNIPSNNVYSFGVLLLEIVTGKIPYSVDDSVLKDWTSGYLCSNGSVTEMADPVLNDFEVQQLERISEVIRSCINLDQRRRPSMKEVSVRLREITSIGPDRAIPRLSPLWWAELEILSVENTSIRIGE